MRTGDATAGVWRGRAAAGRSSWSALEKTSARPWRCAPWRKRLGARGVCVGMTSIGRDGEAFDAADSLEKPRLFLQPGTLVATARRLLPPHPASELLDFTPWTTAAGPVLFAAYGTRRITNWPDRRRRPACALAFRDLRAWVRAGHRRRRTGPRRGTRWRRRCGDRRGGRFSSPNARRSSRRRARAGRTSAHSGGRSSTRRSYESTVR